MLALRLRLEHREHNVTITSITWAQSEVDMGGRLACTLASASDLA